MFHGLFVNEVYDALRMDPLQVATEFRKIHVSTVDGLQLCPS